jgi:probable rRNA maturation factor
MQNSFHFESDKIHIDFINAVESSALDIEKVKQYFEASVGILWNFLFEDVFKNQEMELITLSVHLCDSEKIKHLNSKFRNKDKETDVLSFPVHEDLYHSDEPIHQIQLELGDIFICSDVALEQSKDFNITLEEEFIHLFTHGFLHLCGLDHERNEQEEELMQNYETQLLKKIGQELSKNNDL